MFRCTPLLAQLLRVRLEHHTLGSGVCGLGCGVCGLRLEPQKSILGSSGRESLRLRLQCLT